jgi:hypothetical protein
VKSGHVGVPNHEPLPQAVVRWSAQYKATAKTTKAAVIMTATIKSTGMSYADVPADVEKRGAALLTLSR